MPNRTHITGEEIKCVKERKLKMNRYYLTERPPMPGAIPGGGKVTNIEDFGEKVTCDIGNGKSIKAWGYIETGKPLNDEDVSRYELIEKEV